MMRSWSCIQGGKVNDLSFESVTEETSRNPKWIEHPKLFERQYINNPEFIRAINQETQGTWKAKSYPEFEKYTLAEMQARQGFEIMNNLSEMDTQEKLEKARATIFPTDVPTNWDWRNIDGKRYDSPVWDQAGCGSCFAFASKSTVEAKVRIQTNLNSQPVFSVQEMITCGMDENYNQGCSGGFAYLVAGKQMYERGFVEENCDAQTLIYNYSNKTCPSVSNSCKRWYASDYEYLGGYYGAADVGMMLRSLYNNGPLSVGIAVPSDFRSYSSGIYYSTLMGRTADPWNPLEPTGHAVVIVGYGRCPKSVQANDSNCNVGDDDLPYWIVKNSWGESFGEGGYIRVLMGVDEIYIESKPVRIDVTAPY